MRWVIGLMLAAAIAGCSKQEQGASQATPSNGTESASAVRQEKAVEADKDKNAVKLPEVVVAKKATTDAREQKERGPATMPAVVKEAARPAAAATVAATTAPASVSKELVGTAPSKSVEIVGADARSAVGKSLLTDKPIVPTYAPAVTAPSGYSYPQQGLMREGVVPAGWTQVNQSRANAPQSGGIWGHAWLILGPNVKPGQIVGGFFGEWLNGVQVESNTGLTVVDQNGRQTNLTVPATGTVTVQAPNPGQAPKVAFTPGVPAPPVAATPPVDDPGNGVLGYSGPRGGGSGVSAGGNTWLPMGMSSNVPLSSLPAGSGAGQTSLFGASGNARAGSVSAISGASTSPTTAPAVVTTPVTTPPVVTVPVAPAPVVKVVPRRPVVPPAAPTNTGSGGK